MTVYETIKALKATGLFKESIKNGLISSIYIDYCSVFQEYIQLMESGNKKMDAYFILSESHSVSESTIRNIIRLLS